MPRRSAVDPPPRSAIPMPPPLSDGPGPDRGPGPGSDEKDDSAPGAAQPTGAQIAPNFALGALELFASGRAGRPPGQWRAAQAAAEDGADEGEGWVGSGGWVTEEELAVARRGLEELGTMIAPSLSGDVGDDAEIIGRCARLAFSLAQRARGGDRRGLWCSVA